MEITKITVSLGAKVPLVQYGSLDPSIFISADLTSEDDPQACIKELSEMARAELAQMILPIALRRLNGTELAEMFKVVKGWEVTQVLRMVMPHIDLSEHVTLGDITIEKAQAAINAGFGQNGRQRNKLERVTDEPDDFVMGYDG